jgi:hypothetical protein
MDLDDELRRLFDSDRLDVPVRPDAEHIIVTGARRVRRRRIATAATSGAVAVVAVVITGVALASGAPDAMPPASRNSPSATMSSSTADTNPSIVSATDPAPPVGTTVRDRPKHTSSETHPTDTSLPELPNLSLPTLGPTGLRELALGQTLEEAQATGMLGALTKPGNGGCDFYELLVDGTSNGFVAVSGTVQAIDGSLVRTPEGIEPGATLEQAKAVYPDLDEQSATENGRALVAVPGNDNAKYRLRFSDGVVTEMTLQAADQTCYE